MTNAQILTIAPSLIRFATQREAEDASTQKTAEWMATRKPGQDPADHIYGFAAHPNGGFEICTLADGRKLCAAVLAARAN
jgi:hypothetical protein